MKFKERKEYKLYSELLNLVLLEKTLKVDFKDKSYFANNIIAVNVIEEFITNDFKNNSDFKDKLNKVYSSCFITNHFHSTLKELSEFTSEIDSYSFFSYSTQETIISLLAQQGLVLVNLNNTIKKAFKLLDSWTLLHPSTLLELNKERNRLLIEVSLENKKISIILCVKSMFKSWTHN